MYFSIKELYEDHKAREIAQEAANAAGTSADDILWAMFSVMNAYSEPPTILVSEEMYKRLQRTRKRHRTIAQKERAQIKRLHREQAKRRRKLEEHFRKK